MTTSHRRPASKSLRGRRALVTAGSGRLGRAMVLALAGAGADVVVHFRSDEAGALRTRDDAQALGVSATIAPADLAEDGACEALVATAHTALGGLDILVNNAAIFERTPLMSLQTQDFDRHMRINARTVHALSLAAGTRMRGERGGDIVNMACVSAFRPFAGFVPYSASKAAVVSLTQGFAKLLAPTVRVNAIAPGPVLPPAGADAAQGERAIAATLLKRWGSPDDITAALLFLLRATYVTGYTLPVDGGRTIA